MKNVLKHYYVELETKGPVFVGSGREINKKEYLFFNKKNIGVIDIQKWYQEMKRRHKELEFEKFLLGKDKEGLSGWIRRQGIEKQELKLYMKYQLECGDTLTEQGSKLQIMEGIKDAYGMPYIPGSTLKGMFRTLILTEDIKRRPQQYENIVRNIKRELQNDIRRKMNRTMVLKRENAEIEGSHFCVLKKNEKKASDAVNDYMQGFIVSDSEPLQLTDLVLCQRIEKHTDGSKKNLPILRECLKPGSKIRFTITVDTTLCKLDKDRLENCIKTFSELYNENFTKSFFRSAPLLENEVLLGGGTGFVSKTVLYPLFEKNMGLTMAQSVFQKTGVNRQHKHYKDKEYGASPHILKCTSYEGKIYQMGRCRIHIREN